MGELRRWHMHERQCLTIQILAGHWTAVTSTNTDEAVRVDVTCGSQANNSTFFDGAMHFENSTIRHTV